MAYSYEQTVAGGGTKVVQVPFPKMSRDHVEVYLNNVAQPKANFVWLSDTAIELPDYISAGTVVRSQRNTPKLAPLVTFLKGRFDELDLNRALLQQLYVTQEAYDAAALITEDTIGGAVQSALTAAQQANGYLQALIVVRNDIVNENGPVSIVAGDLGGTGWAYDMGLITDPDDGSVSPPPGNIRTVAQQIDDITDLASVIGAIAALGPHATSIAALGPVAGSLDDATAIIPYASHLVALGPVAAHIATLGPRAADIAALGPIAADITAVAAGGGVPPNGSVTSAKIATAGLDFGSAT